VGVSGAAHASASFQFNPFGNGIGVGLINGAFIIDQAPGSTLALGGAVPGAGGVLPIGLQITDYYQANLNSIQDLATNNLFSNGTGNAFFTFVADFTETVIASTVAGPTVTNSFAINSGKIKMCAQAALGNNLAGTGFACAGNGILSGTVIGGFATQTGFPANLQALDQAGLVDNWGGTTSVTSAGAATLQVTIDFVDPNYFPDLPVGTAPVFALNNTSLITPFLQVDPSRLFSSDGVANGDTPANVGAINGLTGPNFIFQSDANTSFTVPEPGSLALLGSCLAGLCGMRRRRSA
jgi:hypothetical protein